MDTLNVKIEKAEGQTLTILEGKVLDPKPNLPVNIDGTLESVQIFLSKRVSTLEINKCYILVNRDKMEIALTINEDDPHIKGNVTGRLELHPDFKKFRINSGETWSTFELSDFIKMNRSVFSSKEVAMKLVAQLRDFKAKVNKAIDAFKDDRANYSIKQAQAVESNLPEVFAIDVPIFKGQPKQNIPIEINIHPETLGCQLCSPDANDLVKQIQDTEIDKQLDAIREIAGDIVIVEV